MKKTLRGFTMVEVMIAAAVSTIVIFGALTLLQVSNKQLDAIHAKMTLEEQSREALFKMAQEIRQTSSLQITTLNEHTIIFNVPIPKPDASTLVDEQYNPLYAAEIQYSLDADTHQIIRTSTDSDGVKRAVLANNITGLAFSAPSSSPSLITLQISAQQILSDGRQIPSQPLQLTTQAKARNPK